MKINFDKDFEKNTLALFKKMLEENTFVVKLQEPFDSLSMIITDDKPKSFLISFNDESSGKNGYVVSKSLNAKM